jgi:hypothetical protein
MVDIVWALPGMVMSTVLSLFGKVNISPGMICSYN